MKNIFKYIIIMLGYILTTACSSNNQPIVSVIKPKIVTEPTRHDTDDPAIWINEDDPEASLILGTDKNEDGAIYVYDLNGKIQTDKVVRGLKRPNNIDIEEFEFGDGSEIFIAVTTERLTNKLRIFSVPDMLSIDNGGIEVFTGEIDRAPMGISLYKRESDDVIFAIVGRKSGPSDGYLWQYRLDGNPDGTIGATMVRSFGTYSGEKEIEAIAVDDEYGYVYYSDEGVGVRKYHADPDQTNEELALFATTGIADDHEGISIYKTDMGTGYIILSDQQANKFHFFSREGTKLNPHDHQLIKVINAACNFSDGSEVTNASLGSLFPKGLFVAMSDDKTFHFYDWEDLAGDDLLIAPDGLVEHTENAIQPKYVTEKVVYDSDDPAIWVNSKDPAASLIIGTDKEVNGGLYVFDLHGKVVKMVTELGRPNNVDIAYGFKLNDELVDIVITTERSNNQLRIFSVPDMEPIDNGGLEVFEGVDERGPMGIAFYTASDGILYAIVGRTDGPLEGYLWQYRIEDAGNGNVKLVKVREFGKYSGVKEIEAIAVDNELGFVYYADEAFGVRKYYANPAMGNEELALFGTDDFGRDIEGISIYKTDDKTGYILISDQQVGTFNIYPREGTLEDPNSHQIIKAVELMTLESDGSEVSSTNLGPEFPKGIFVAMSTDKTFHIYDWRDIASQDLSTHK
jgi:myo-inositol-hexaphosphate 3-phosphohydrolase|tara:strand:- start:1726 stop:3777 length:2052 start_codon:yes stop_codon:yes gene_type:complete